MHYLNNKDFYVEMVISKAQGHLTDKAKIMIELLAKKTIKKFRFYNQDDKMDCYMFALLDMYSNWYNFDEDRYQNAFSYFTEIFKRGSAKGLNTLYKKKGDNDKSIKMISLNSSNDGNGMHSI